MKTCSFMTGVKGFTREYVQGYLSRAANGSTDRLYNRNRVKTETHVSNQLKKSSG